MSSFSVSGFILNVLIITLCGHWVSKPDSVDSPDSSLREAEVLFPMAVPRCHLGWLKKDAFLIDILPSVASVGTAQRMATDDERAV